MSLSCTVVFFRYCDANEQLKVVGLLICGLYWYVWHQSTYNLGLLSTMGSMLSVPEPLAPPKLLLPNGGTPPVFCDTCPEGANVCTCALVAIPNDNVGNLQSRPLALVASKAAAVALGAIQDAASAHCGKCKRAACQCAQVKNERDAIELPVLIDNMIAFCDAMNKCASVRGDHNKASASEHDRLTKQGEFLKKRHACLEENKGKGVLIPHLLKLHLDDIQAWLAACDKFNETLCATEALGSAANGTELRAIDETAAAQSTVKNVV